MAVSDAGGGAGAGVGGAGAAGGGGDSGSGDGGAGTGVVGGGGGGGGPAGRARVLPVALFALLPPLRRLLLIVLLPLLHSPRDKYGLPSNMVALITSGCGLIARSVQGAAGQPYPDDAEGVLIGKFPEQQGINALQIEVIAAAPKENGMRVAASDGMQHQTAVGIISLTACTAVRYRCSRTPRQRSWCSWTA